MGTSLSNEDRQKIIDKCISILKEDRFVNIKFAAEHFIKKDIKYLDDAIIIACRISENSEYSWRLSEMNGWPYLFINPDHTLNESTKQTGRIQRKALRIIVGIGFLTLAVTGINVWPSIKYQKKQLNIQERQLDLTPPPILIDSVVVHQHLP